MMVLIRTFGDHEVAEDAEFYMNMESIVEGSKQDALLEVPDDWTDVQIEEALLKPLRFTGQEVTLTILVPKEET